MSNADFCPDLIRRYNVKGPRYTSYPTADQFLSGDWATAYQSTLHKTDLQALSLYLHVPFCATICYYCACNKINTANVQKAEVYVERLIREMALHAAHIGTQHRVEQIHFGGGTPTFLNTTQFDRVFAAMHRHFCLSDDETRDFSVEIDPRAATAQDIAHLAGLGINRISIGVQDFDPTVQLAVNRIQSVDETREVVEAARNNGIHSINLDLINGLPKQSVNGFERTLDQVISLNPDRLSLYSYAHLPHRFKTQKQIRANDLPNAETKLKLLSTTVSKLASAGYDYVGMDHFAKSTDSLIDARDSGTLQRNFQGYTTHGHCQLIGLGVSSIGNVGPIYVQNVKTLDEYYRAIDNGDLAIERGLEAGVKDLITGEVIQDLMCRSSVRYDAFRDRSGFDFQDYYSAAWPQLLDLKDDALIELLDTELRVTQRGRYLLRIICMAFDEYLQKSEQKFSRAI